MGILTEMLVCEDMTSCTDFARRHVVDEIATFCHCFLPSNSYYTVVASIFLVSAASCKVICRVASVRTLYYSQPFWLKGTLGTRRGTWSESNTGHGPANTGHGPCWPGFGAAYG